MATFHIRKVQVELPPDLSHCVANLLEFQGAGHGFQGEDAKKSTEDMVAWFVTHLSGPSAK